MKSISPRSLTRMVVIALAFSLVPAFAATRTESPADTAAQLLTAQGRVPVHAAGPYVERGTFLIQVLTKLGRPDHRLPDGTWLYHRRSIAGSEARGTLVVRFDGGRVSELTMVAPAIAAAMRAAPATNLHAERFAKR